MKRGTSKGDDTIMEDTPEDPDKEGVEGTSVDKVEPKDAADKTADDLKNVLASTLKDKQLTGVLAFLDEREVDSVEMIKSMTEGDFESLMLGINPEGRRSKVREAFLPMRQDPQSVSSEVLDKLNDLAKLVEKLTATVEIIKCDVEDEKGSVISDLDIWTHASSNATASFKKKLLTYYGINKNKNKEIMCMILGTYLPKSQIKAAHIWMSHTHGSGLAKFGLRREDLHSPRNGLLLYEKIEEAFDVKKLCFLYDPFKRLLLLFVLDPALNGQTVVGGIKFQDIHCTPLRIPSGKLPFLRILNFHARVAFANAKRNGWIADSVEVYDYFDLSDKSARVSDRFPDPYHELCYPANIIRARCQAKWKQDNNFYNAMVMTAVDDHVFAVQFDVDKSTQNTHIKNIKFV